MELGSLTVDVLGSPPSLVVNLPQLIQLDSPQHPGSSVTKCLHSFFANGRIIRPLITLTVCPYAGTLVLAALCTEHLFRHCCCRVGPSSRGPMQPSHTVPSVHRISSQHSPGLSPPLRHMVCVLSSRLARLSSDFSSLCFCVPEECGGFPGRRLPQYPHTHWTL